MRAVLALFLCSLLVPAAPGQDPTKTTARIVGTWEGLGGENLAGGLTLEFTKDGKLRLSFQDLEGYTYSEETTYKVNPDGTTITAKVPGDKTGTMTDKIKKLTETELVLENDEGYTETFKRVK